jgi:hypothetical protein
MIAEIRTALAAFAIALTATSLLGTGAVTAHTYSPAHFYSNCNTGNETYNPRAYVVRDTGSYKKVQSTVTWGSLYSCTQVAGSSAAGYSLIVAVTGQGAGTGNFIQAGIANRGCNGTKCENGFSNNLTDFWYSADNQCSIYAATWVDFDGRTYPRHYPVAGHKYLFTIDFYTNDTFRYCIGDLTQYGHACTTVPHPTGLPYWGTAWWGFETYNDASALGYLLGESDYTELSPLQYMNYNGSIFTTVTNNPNRPNCDWVVDGPYPAPDHWLSQHCVVGGGTGTTTVSAYTSWHS